MVLNLNTGGVVWKQRIGEYAELNAKGINTGRENLGSPVVTAGALVSIPATRDEKIRRSNKLACELFWEPLLRAGGIARPGRIQVNGKECVAPACGDAGSSDEVGR
jgi:quinoprotein glucose dehydrogenase